jgi:NADH:ubiquinone oxidoreductase subunit 5 (subunit L)/multisubunit Na+/H+ antiporter MnhA subunit
MFVGLGTGAFSGGIFHLFNHAFFKAMLFLCSGAVIHGLHGEQDIRKMGGLRKFMPITAYCCLIGTLSISGCPGLSGFFSKDEIIASAYKYNPWLGGLMIFTAFLTAFYMFRLYFMTFEKTYRGDAHPHESSPVVWLPLVVLAVPSILSGYLGFNWQALNLSSVVGLKFDGSWSAPLANHFAAFVHFGKVAEFEGMNGLIMVISTAAALIGFALAWMVYQKESVHINSAIAESRQPLIAGLYKFSYDKWKFDELYLWLVNGLFLPLFNGLWKLIDQFVIDNLVNLSGTVTLATGNTLRFIQNGRGQYYALVIFACVAGLTFLAYFMRP